MLLFSADAWLYALDGDRLAAVRKAIRNHRLRTGRAWRVLALASGAGLSQAFGESGHARILADDAAKLAVTVDWNDYHG